MHVVVIGAGVVGMTTAWALAREGHRVSVVDAAGEPAAGASHGNGAQLSYSYVAPLAGPSIWRDLPGLLFSPDAPVRFRPTLDPFQYRWGLKFLANCTARAARQTTAALLQLAFLSRDTVKAAEDVGALDFDWRESGKLVVYSKPESFAAARAQVELQAGLGCRQTVLDRDACLAREPALATIAHRLAGGIHTADDAAADPVRLCLGLRALLSAGNAAVDFRFGTRATRLVRDGTRLKGIDTNAGLIEADAYVLAGGYESRALARSVGIGLPIYPIKGYSLTVDVGDEAAAPLASITDYANKIVYARLGAKMRIAGMADIVGPGRDLAADRVAQLVRQAKETFPGAADWSGDLKAWTGMRPATPSGRPIIGASGIDNLALNVGHGPLGFTLAFGSAAALAAHLAGRTPPVSLEEFSLARA
ncbi:MAG: D-amino acid dehydrogenase [Reyranellaceae bacterium]